MSAQVYSASGQTEGIRKALWKWKSIDLSYKLSLTCGGNVSYYKSVHHPIPTRGNREHPGNFQNKSVSSPFSWVTRYILMGEDILFWWVQEGGPHCVRLPPRTFGCHKRWKSLFYCETWNNPTPPLLFIRLPYK